MSTPGVLFRNEMIKTTKRPATTVTTGLFVVLMCMIAGSAFYEALIRPARGPFALPVSWPSLIEEPGVPSAFFAAILLILLVTSEFSWRTARQNVIDGLTKDQWFAGKLVLFAVVCLSYFALHLLVVGSVAAYGSYETAGGLKVLARSTDVQMMGADLLMVGGLCSVAFFAAFATRSAGPAMALFFFYLAFGERLIGLVLQQIGGSAKAAIAFLPMKLYTEIPEAVRWDPASLEKAIAAAAKNNRPPPDLSNTHALVWVGLAELVVFIAAAYLVYRRRDL